MIPIERTPVHRFAHEAMATVFELFIAGKDRTYAGQAARAAFDEVDRLERLFSRFDPSSETSRIGRLGPGQSLLVGIETAQVLGLSAFLQAETGGAFDVNYLAARGAARGGRRGRPRSLSELLSVGLDENHVTVTRVRPAGRAAALPVDLDLGAVGKGYALDAALDILKDWDVRNVLVHAGTSTALAAGPGPEADSGRPGRGWPVGAGGPASTSSAPGRVILTNRALSGSGTEVKGGHIVDPRTGRPARGHAAAWASHPSAAAADALSTAFLVMTTTEVAGFCRRHPGVWALVKTGAKTCRIFNAGSIARKRSA